MAEIRGPNTKAFLRQLRREVRKAMSEEATPVRREMRERVKPHKESGDLQRSIRKTVRVRRNGEVAARIGPVLPRSLNAQSFERLKLSELVKRGHIEPLDGIEEEYRKRVIARFGQAFQNAVNQTPKRTRKP